MTSTGVPFGQALRRAAVGVGLPAGARAVGGLADVDGAGGVGVDEVRGALGTVGVGHDARMDGGGGGGCPVGGGGGGGAGERGGDGESGEKGLAHIGTNDGRAGKLALSSLTALARLDRPHELAARAGHAAGDRRRCARRGDEVLVTARDFAQTLGLLERFQIDHTAIGHHRGGKLAAKGARARVSAPARSCAGRAGAGSTSRSATAPTTSRSPPSCCGSRPRPRSTTSWRACSTRSTAGSPRASSSRT